jgi:hypothetical protein
MKWLCCDTDHLLDCFSRNAPEVKYSKRTSIFTTVGSETIFTGLYINDGTPM